MSKFPEIKEIIKRLLLNRNQTSGISNFFWHLFKKTQAKGQTNKTQIK